MSSTKFGSITRLMTTYNFEIEDLPDNLMCRKCKLVLKDACLVMCGCTFCRNCIDDMIETGVEYCPGGFQDCEESPLSLFVSDYRANNRISKLTVKCPNTGCMYECRLFDMVEHLEECQKKSIICPFRDVGCTTDKLVAEAMNEHFQQENSKHSEILISMIANINRDMERDRQEMQTIRESNEESWREIKMLKCTDGDNERKIEILQHELEMKEGQIRMIIDQVIHLENENISIKQENENLTNQIRILSMKMDEHIDQRRDRDELESARLIDHIDREVATITGLIGSNKDEFISEIQSVRDDILSINQYTQSIMEDIYSMKSQVESIQALVGLVDANCEMVIDEHVAETQWNWGHNASDYFTGAVYPYKYRLSSNNVVSPCGSLQIYLRIHNGPSDGELAWPFEGRVVITVAEKDRREASRSISRQCRIVRPSDNYYRSSDRFDFSHSVLTGAGLDLDRGVCVLCQIVPGAGR